MKTRGAMTRRRFVTQTLLGSTAVAMGLPRRAAWSMSTAVPKRTRFIFYTDVHTRLEWDTPVALARAAKAINRLNPDFVIAGGDLITDGFQSSAKTVAPRWDAYMAFHESINAPVYPVIGNHDYVAAMPTDGSKPAVDPRRIFKERMGVNRTYRTFEQSGCRFFLLDSIDVQGGEDRYRGHVSDEQMGWLKETLVDVPKAQPIVLASHIPIMTLYQQALEGSTTAAPVHRVVDNNREVIGLFNGHNLMLVLQGHVHVDELMRWCNTTFITGGAICAKWWRGPWHGTEEGFGVVTLEGDRVEWEYVDYGWDARRPSRM